MYDSQYECPLLVEDRTEYPTNVYPWLYIFEILGLVLKYISTRIRIAVNNKLIKVTHQTQFI